MLDRISRFLQRKEREVPENEAIKYSRLLACLVQKDRLLDQQMLQDVLSQESLEPNRARIAQRALLKEIESLIEEIESGADPMGGSSRADSSPTTDLEDDERNEPFEDE
jgi:hypothetical protein